VVGWRRRWRNAPDGALGRDGDVERSGATAEHRMHAPRHQQPALCHAAHFGKCWAEPDTCLFSHVYSSRCAPHARLARSAVLGVFSVGRIGVRTHSAFRVSVSSSAVEGSRAWPPHTPREGGLTHPAGTSRSNLAPAAFETLIPPTQTLPARPLRLTPNEIMCWVGGSCTELEVLTLLCGAVCVRPATTASHGQVHAARLGPSRGPSTSLPPPHLLHHRSTQHEQPRRRRP
jgi:hypothetical protein